MAESLGLDAQTTRKIRERDLGVINIDDQMIAELESRENPLFTTAVERALKTSSDGLSVFQGSATAILMDSEGKVVAFYSTNKDSEHYATFIAAAAEKASAIAAIDSEKRRGGLSRNQAWLVKQGYSRHEGAAAKPVIIKGERFFVGVSGAGVNPKFNRIALRSDGLFAATGEVPEWRAAGYWDRFLANRIRTFLKKPEARKDMGPMKVPRHQAKSSFFD